MRQNDPQLSVVVVGATGATGRHVVSTALERGHRVTALVRRRGSFPEGGPLTERVWDDVTDGAALRPALEGADVVVSTVGGAAAGPTTVCTDAVRSLVPAMDQAGVRRLLVVSAHGVAESHDRSAYALAVWARVADRMRDKEGMEALVTGSDLDWTVVRAPALRDAAAVGRYRVAVDLPIRLWSSFARADLAAFLVDEAERPRFVRAFPRVAR